MTDRKGFVEIRPCVVEGEPDACTVWFKVGVQEFCITPIACEDREHAEWFKQMFVKALDALLVAERERYLGAINRVLPDEKGNLVSSHSVIKRELLAAIRAGVKEANMTPERMTPERMTPERLAAMKKSHSPYTDSEGGRWACLPCGTIQGEGPCEVQELLATYDAMLREQQEAVAEIDEMKLRLKMEAECQEQLIAGRDALQQRVAVLNGDESIVGSFAYYKKETMRMHKVINDFCVLEEKQKAQLAAAQARIIELTTACEQQAGAYNDMLQSRTKVQARVNELEQEVSDKLTAFEVTKGVLLRTRATVTALRTALEYAIEYGWLGCNLYRARIYKQNGPDAGFPRV